MEETTADELSDEGEPNDSRAIQYRDVDGEWHELDVEPKRTGDPELDVLWAMSFDEIMQILDDESHPLHEKAKQVSREITKPMVDAAHQALRPITESIAKSFDASRMAHTVIPKLDIKGLFPALDTSSWFAKLVPDLPKFELFTNLTMRPADTPSFARPLALVVPDERRIDFDTVEPPDASMAEIREAAEVRAHEMRSRQIEVLSDLLMETRTSAESGKKALDLSKQALEATMSSKSAGWFAGWAAVGAGLIGLVGIVVTFVLSGSR